MKDLLPPLFQVEMNIYADDGLMEEATSQVNSTGTIFTFLKVEMKEEGP